MEAECLIYREGLEMCFEGCRLATVYSIPTILPQSPREFGWLSLQVQGQQFEIPKVRGLQAAPGVPRALGLTSFKVVAVFQNSSRKVLEESD